MRTGRPRKSTEPRENIGLYVPISLSEKLRAEARAQGLTLSDYIGQILASSQGMDWTVRTPPRKPDADTNQGELFAKTA